MEKDIKKPQIRFQGFTEEWEQHKLGDYCEMYNGDRSSKYPNASDMVDDGIPFINAGDLENGSVNLKTANNITREKYNQLCGAKLQIGDIVYCLRGTLGKNAFIDNFEEGTIASSLVAIRPKNIDGRYLYYILNSDIEYRQRIVHDEGAAQPNLSAKSVSEFEIPILSIGEQKKISEYFTKFDHLISFHQRKYDSLVKVKKSMLEKMFPRSGDKKPEIRFVGFTDDWEQRKLSELATIHARIGWQNLRTSEFLDNGDYMLITGTDFKDGAINYSTCHYVEKERYDQDKHIQINNGSILITKDGTLGKVAYVQGLTMPATLNAGIFNVQIRNENEVDGKYLFQYLKAPYLMNYVSQKATGGTIKHLNQNILLDFPIVLPNKFEQVKIGTFFEKLDNLISLHQCKLNLLKNMKKAMLEKMFV